MKKLRILFMGTPSFALPSLNLLTTCDHQLVGVFTRPPSRQGRGKQLISSPVQLFCQTHKIPCFSPAGQSEEFITTLTKLAPDLIVVVAYGVILSEKVLEIPPLGCLNLHGSLLPKWRGAAPIERAMLAGDPSSGLTLMQMSSGMDEGAILAQREVKINYYQSLDATREQFASLGAELLLSNLAKVDSLEGKQQDHHLASYAPRLTKEELAINWKQAAAEIWRQILVSRGKAWFNYQGERLLVSSAKVKLGKAEPGKLHQAPLTIGCGHGLLEITSVQKPGGKPQPVNALFGKQG